MLAALSLSIETKSVRSPRPKMKFLSSLSRMGKGSMCAGCNDFAEPLSRTKTCVQARRTLFKQELRRQGSRGREGLSDFIKVTSC